MASSWLEAIYIYIHTFWRPSLLGWRPLLLETKKQEKEEFGLQCHAELEELHTIRAASVLSSTLARVDASPARWALHDKELSDGTCPFARRRQGKSSFFRIENGKKTQLSRFLTELPDA